MNSNKTRKKETKLSVTTIINILAVLLTVAVIAAVYISKEMKVQRIEGHKKAAANALKTVQEALKQRDTYNVSNKGWGNFIGVDFCNPPLGMDIDMLAYGAAKDAEAPRSLASYLICSPDKGLSKPVILANSGCSNNIFQAKNGMIFSHMNSSATKWDRAFYVDTNGSALPTESIASFRKKTCALDGGYGDTTSIPDENRNAHERCAPNNSQNNHPDVICLIIRGGNTIIPGDERTKKILETGNAINVKVKK